MLTRVVTAIIGVPLVVLLVTLGSPIFEYVMVVISCLALYELFDTIKTTYNPMKYIGYGTLVIYFVFFKTINLYFMIYISLIMVIALIYMVVMHPKYSIVDVALTLFTTLYVGLLLGFVILTRNTLYGNFWVWLIVISSWGSDTFAYFTGVMIGKHKLAPKLSPKKTIEGSVGGIIGAALLGYTYTIIFTLYAFQDLRPYTGIVILIVIVGSIISQFGDLAASCIKRFFNQKDFGFILPGHGGIIDRLDSLLLVAPVIYGAILIAEHIIR